MDMDTIICLLQLCWARNGKSGDEKMEINFFLCFQLWTKYFAEVLKEGEVLAQQPMPDFSRLTNIHEREMKTLRGTGPCLEPLPLFYDVPLLKLG